MPFHIFCYLAVTAHVQYDFFTSIWDISLTLFWVWLLPLWCSCLVSLFHYSWFFLADCCSSCYPCCTLSSVDVAFQGWFPLSVISGVERLSRFLPWFNNSQIHLCVQQHIFPTALGIQPLFLSLWEDTHSLPAALGKYIHSLMWTESLESSTTIVCLLMCYHGFLFISTYLWP